MILISLSIFVTAFLLSCFALHKTIYVAHKNHLFDHPTEERKIHRHKTPNLGGIAIFSAFIITAAIFTTTNVIPGLNLLLASSVIMVFLGLIDDLAGMDPIKKFMGQIVASSIIVVFTSYRITSFFGFMGTSVLPEFISIPFTILFILLVVNAFNLIDGINCLASGLSLISFITFSVCFHIMDESAFQFMSIAMAGCMTGFILFNKTPAKIFLGDSGSLFIGLMVAIFSIRLLWLNDISQPGVAGVRFPQAASVVFSLLLIPVFDTIRLFTTRLVRKQSPFIADRNHIHHILLDMHFTHMQSTAILCATTCLSLLAAFILPLKIEIFIVGTYIILTIAVNRISNSIKQKRKISSPTVHQEYSPVNPGQNFEWLASLGGKNNIDKYIIRKKSNQTKLLEVKK